MHKAWVISTGLLLVHLLKMKFPASLYICEYLAHKYSMHLFYPSIFRARWKEAAFFLSFPDCVRVSSLCIVTSVSIDNPGNNLTTGYSLLNSLSGCDSIFWNHSRCLVSSRWHYAPHNGALEGLRRQEALWKKGLHCVQGICEAQMHLNAMHAWE